MSGPAPLKYCAFLSYAHADARWGKWLHRQLEGFPVDKELVGRQTAQGTVPKALYPIFRDREDFSGGHALADATIAALDQSKALIVLCSAVAATRPAVNEEIRIFRARHPKRPVIPVILDGDYPDNFPPALRYAIGSDGKVTGEPLTILGPDLREAGDGQTLALAKIVAGLTGLNTDDIARRAERTRRRKLRNWVIGLSGVTVALSALTALAVINWYKAETQRKIAVSEWLFAEARDMHETLPQRSALLAAQAATLAPSLTGLTKLSELVKNQASVFVPVVRPAVMVCMTQAQTLIVTSEGTITAVPRLAPGDRSILLPASPDRETVCSPSHRFFLAHTRETSTAQLWDLSDVAASPVTISLSAPIERVAFSPDSKTIAFGLSNGTLGIWTIPHTRLTTIETGLTEVKGLTFNVNASAILVFNDGRAIVYSIGASGAAVKLSERSFQARIEDAHLSGGLWAAATSSRRLVFWNAAIADPEGKISTHSPPRDEGIRVEGFLRDTDTIVFQTYVDAYIRSIRTLRAADPAPQEAIIWINPSVVASVAISTVSGRAIVLGYYDRTPHRVLSISLGSTIPAPDERALRYGAIYVDPTHRVLEQPSVTFSSSGNAAAILTAQDNAIYYRSGPATDWTTLLGHEGLASKVWLAPDGTTLASFSEDENAVRIWDIYAPSKLSARIETISATDLRNSVIPNLNRIAVSSGGRFFAASRNGSVLIWRGLDPHDPDFREPIGGEAFALAFNPARETELAVGGISESFVIGIDDGAVSRVPLPRGGHIYALSYSHDGNYLIGGSLDDSILIWKRSESGWSEPSVRKSGNNANIIFCLALSPDGSRLVAGGETGASLSLHTFREGELSGPQFFAAGSKAANCRAAAFSLDGVHLASSGAGTYLWRSDHLERPPQQLSDSASWGLSFGRDSRTLAVTSTTPAIYLWNVENTSDGPLKFIDGQSAKNDLALWSDENLVISANTAGEIHFRTLDLTRYVNEACHVAGRSFNSEEVRLFRLDQAGPLQCELREAPPRFKR